MSAFRRLCGRFARDDRGAATLEFVIALPIVLALALTGIDVGALMLRQASLDRAVDVAVREVRLGRVTSTSTGRAGFIEEVCRRTILLHDCRDTITVEMRPIDRTTWAEVSTPTRCIDRDAPIRPVLTFDPRVGDQDLMMVRICVLARPFVGLSGRLLGMPPEGGDVRLVARAAFANEP